jgi:hypothetical protein
MGSDSLKTLLDIWPFSWLYKRYQSNKKFKDKLAELRKRDPFNDSDE